MKTLPLTSQEAFEKYFGTVDELVKGSYPWKCKQCDYLLLHLDSDWESHLRENHNERIMSNKQIERIEQRRKEKEESLRMENNFISSIKGTN